MHIKLSFPSLSELLQNVPLEDRSLFPPLPGGGLPSYLELQTDVFDLVYEKVGSQFEGNAVYLLSNFADVFFEAFRLDAINIGLHAQESIVPSLGGALLARKLIEVRRGLEELNKDLRRQHEQMYPYLPDFNNSPEPKADQ